MTVNTTNSRIMYAGDGVATVFPVTFVFRDETDFIVLIVSPLGVVSQAALNIDYTVELFVNFTGEVTFLAAPANGSRVVILRNHVVVQETESTGKEEFTAPEVESIADSIMFIVQEIWDKVQRSLQLFTTDLDGSGRYDANQNRIVNLADAVNDQDAVNKRWFLANAIPGPPGDPGAPGPGVTGVQTYSLRNVAGTPNAITANTGAALGALVQYDQFWFTPASNNTGPAQINIDGIGLKDIKSPTDGALAADELFVGRYYNLLALGNPVSSLRIIAGF